MKVCLSSVYPVPYQPGHTLVFNHINNSRCFINTVLQLGHTREVDTSLFLTSWKALIA